MAHLSAKVSIYIFKGHASSKRKNGKHEHRVLVIVTPTIAAVFILCAFICCYIRKAKAKQNEGNVGLKSLEGSSIEKDIGKNVDLDVFDVTTLTAATDNFSHSNKLGEGGFGSVYKGKLQNGLEIAVKRLSQSSEYAMQGLFSVKSDVFSFGILVLEIISGRRNNSYSQESSVNLIGHVWDLWKQAKALTVATSSLGDSFDTREVILCIHVGILCVQELASDRPTMSDVAHKTVLPSPNQPAFIFRQANYGRDCEVGSVCDEDITILHPR
ncbi:G-type lectin S-receptor-like serine/threonine-protein kinase RKS1 [Bidens hawaiensis]|uniref:G-type lectin S-receptor-like serine/threonine-protein kinase RKS1 n=1 Tax=Bidens hawaiensis TaxID=980011 RepID=UPI00404A7A7A